MSEKRPSTETELIEYVRSIDVRAPDALHQSVQAMIARRGDGRRTDVRRFAGVPRIAAGAALAAAALAVALVVALAGTGTATLSNRTAAAVTLRPATAAAPQRGTGSRAELAASVEGLHFPYWTDGLGWHATGQRQDTVAGHAITTVFYADGSGRRVAYAIVAGAAPPLQGATHRRGGVAFALSSEGGANTVSWVRAGHLCIVSGHDVGHGTLLRLASWAPRGTPA